MYHLLGYAYGPILSDHGYSSTAYIVAHQHRPKSKTYVLDFSTPLEMTCAEFRRPLLVACALASVDKQRCAGDEGRLVRREV